MAARMTTDSTEYLAHPVERVWNRQRYGAMVAMTFANDESRPRYLARCRSDDRTPIYGVERMTVDDAGSLDRESAAAYDPRWACVGDVAPIEVGPNATRVDTIRLTGPQLFHGATNEPVGLLEGRFRVTYRVRGFERTRDCARSDVVVRSNGFVVRLPGE
jgi:hypothetical protein